MQLKDYDKATYIHLAQKSFWAFCVYYDTDFFHHKRRFLKPVAIAFQSVIDNYKAGKAIKVSVSMPPRAGKSYITSLFAAYWLGTFPELSVMRNTCTSTLYDKFSYDTRAVVRSDKFKEVFPTLELAPDKQNLCGWSLTTAKQVSYFGAGVGGSIIGFGANLAITDDLYKSMQDALSTTVQQSIKSWKQSAHDSRKEKHCPEVYIGTRWTKDDIIGEAIDTNELEHVIIIPALTDDDQSFCEDVKTTEEYLKIRESITPSIWAAEYMQQPYDIEGTLLPKESIKFTDYQPPEKDISYTFAVCDPADTGGDKYSFAIIQVVANESNVYFFVKDVIHSQIGIEENTYRATDRINANKVEQLIVEANGVGLAAVKLFKIKLPQSTKLSPITASAQKEVRILSSYEFIQQYFIFSSEAETTNAEYKLFIKDLTSYTKDGDNKHRADAIDVLSTAAEFVKRKYKSVLYDLHS